MDEDRRRPARSSAPAGLIGMLALVASVEAFLALGDHGFECDRAVDGRDRARLVGQRSAPGEISCFGDSLIKFGIVPRIIEARIGKKASNFAMIGAQPVASYFLLRRSLASGARPAAIVVDFQAYLLAQAPRFGASTLPAYLTTSECLDLARTGGDLDFPTTVLLSKPLLSLRFRPEIRTAITQALGGEAHPATETNRLWVKSARRNWALNDGALILGQNPQFHGQTENFHQPLFPVGWESDPVGKLYVRRFLALATAKGIPIFWLIPPHCTAVQEGRERAGSNAAYDRFVREVHAEFPEVVVIDGRRSGYADSLFYDPVHLNRDGASTLSVVVAEAIRPYLAGRSGPRRIDLPGPVGLDRGGATLEDVGQSIAIIGAGEGSKRVR